MTKSITKYNNTKVEKFLKVFETGPPGKMFLETRVLHEAPGEKIIYKKMSMGKFMSYRDQVIKKVIKEQPDGSTLMTIENVEHEDAPEVPGVIRMQMFKGVKIQQVGNDIELSDFSSIDLKGYFPLRLMNMMLATRMPILMKNLREELDKIPE